MNGENHALKIQVLNPTIAVAFAGDVEASLDLIHTLHVKLSADSRIDPCEQLFASYHGLPRGHRHPIANFSSCS